VKAHVCTQLGLPNQLQFKEIDDPTPTPNQVLVSVKAAGVNFPDGLIVAGTYQTKPPLPFIPGSEVAGVVHSVGSDVQGVTPGVRVMAFCGMGGYAELVAVTSDKVFVIPDSMSFSDAAGFVVTYGTSYHALVDRAAIRPGETLLVLGASGGVGLTAIEIGKALGARVVAAASSEAKLEVCKQHGADELINYTTGNLRERVAQVAPSGVDVVYDPVGGDHAATAVRALSTAGRYLTVGYASGQIPKIGMNRLLVVGGALHGVLWGAWAKRNPECNADNMRALFDMYDGGALSPHVNSIHPLINAPTALEEVMSRRALGKVILSTNPE